jgi:hypothetical protein
MWYPESEIRGWLRDAAAYHDVPLALACVILQQENGPNATTFQKLGQFTERSLQTAGALLDDVIDIVPDSFAGGSSGIANMSRATLRDAASYIEKTYKMDVMPNDVRVRAMGADADTRVQGNDMRADFYYMTAHLRQLIDRIMGTKKYHGPITIEDVEKICAAYNGSGKLAQKYGKDAVARLKRAVAGEEPLYFYELAGAH